MRNSDLDIYEGDLHNRQQYRDWHWEAFAIPWNICFKLIADHRLWTVFHWHWIKYVVLYLLCFTDKALISTSFHRLIGQSARTLQTCIIELNWIIYQKILWILAFWLTDFADKEPVCSKSFRIYNFRFYSVKNLLPILFQSTWVLGERDRLFNSDITFILFHFIFFTTFQ